jgi:hypothetical protein
LPSGPSSLQVHIGDEGADPVAVIVSANAARRQMTVGAMAIVAAKTFPDAIEPENQERTAAGTFGRVK